MRNIVGRKHVRDSFSDLLLNIHLHEHNQNKREMYGMLQPLSISGDIDLLRKKIAVISHSGLFKKIYLLFP